MTSLYLKFMKRISLAASQSELVEVAKDIGRLPPDTPDINDLRQALADRFGELS